MEYALLAYSSAERDPARPIEESIAAVLARPCVTGWVRLHAKESATTVGNALLTDGPFVDTKEYLVGLILVEADNLDGALAIARELQDTRTSGAIEVRPVVESLLRGA